MLFPLHYDSKNHNDLLGITCIFGAGIVSHANRRLFPCQPYPSSNERIRSFLFSRVAFQLPEPKFRYSDNSLGRVMSTLISMRKEIASFEKQKSPARG
ncbi:hypothetical protein TNCT_174741 [Trichonephila clavata]|uniref:Uncharacterized protein n=1 Tax=Trichonephila clavata TaxID=2740835 RepID=A0A8X6GHF8_TRICU|nr:hypothetical protein TNCT_174741 [Trichonephila clavata]